MFANYPRNDVCLNFLSSKVFQNLKTLILFSGSLIQSQELLDGEGPQTTIRMI